MLLDTKPSFSKNNKCMLSLETGRCTTARSKDTTGELGMLSWRVRVKSRHSNPLNSNSINSNISKTFFQLYHMHT